MSAPVVLVDMDGPLADFDLHFWLRCQEAGYGFDVGHVNDQRHRYFTDHLTDPAEKRAARAMVDAPGWFESLPVVAGAVDGVHAMIAAGWEVWVCTKPLEANPTCRDAKAAWLAEHFGKGFDRRLIITPDKSLVRGDVLLDDAPKPEWFARASWRPVIFDAPFNRDGSEWGHLDRWTWGQPLAQLIPTEGAKP